MAINRQLALHDTILNSSESELTKTLLTNYNDASARIANELRATYQNLAVNGVINPAELRKFERLQRINTMIRDEMVSLSSTNRTEIIRHFKFVFEDSYYYAGFVLETEAQARLRFEFLQTDVINASVQNDFTGLTLNERLQANRNTTINQLRTEITQGLIRGDTFTTVSKAVSARLTIDRNKSLRIVRTENNRLRNQGRLDAYLKANANGITLDKQWVATLDERTRSTHRALDGQIVGVTEPFRNGDLTAVAPNQFIVASQDINCRCRIVARLRGFETASDYRSRQNTRIQNREVVPYDNYDDWRNNRLSRKE